MDSELLKKLKAVISDLLIRYPLYRFRKGQADEYRLRVLLAAEKEYLVAALSQILPNGQLLDTRLEDVLAALKQAGITVTTVHEKEDWRCVEAKRS